MDTSLLPRSLQNRARPVEIPYSTEALRHDVDRVRVAWRKSQSKRGRDAIYGYLSAVYGLVAW